MSENDEKVVELVARAEKASLKWVLQLMKNFVLDTGKSVKQTVTHVQTTGKQRYDQLKKTGSLEHVDVAKTDLAALQTELKRYKVDFSIQHNKETGKYHVFFKAKDRDTLNLALENVIAKFSKEQNLSQEKGKETPEKEKKPSLDIRLKEAKQKAEKINANRTKEKESVRSNVKAKSKGQER